MCAKKVFTARPVEEIRQRVLNITTCREYDNDQWRPVLLTLYSPHSYLYTHWNYRLAQTMCNGVLKNEKIEYKWTFVYFNSTYTTKTITTTWNDTTALTTFSISRTIQSEKFSLDKFPSTASHDFDRPFVRRVVYVNVNENYTASREYLSRRY